MGDQGPVTKRLIAQVLADHTDNLMALPGVVGTAQGLSGGAPCIRVFVVRKTADLLQRIPTALEGYAVEVEETGEFRAL